MIHTLNHRIPVAYCTGQYPVATGIDHNERAPSITGITPSALSRMWCSGCLEAPGRSRILDLRRTSTRCWSRPVSRHALCGTALGEHEIQSTPRPTPNGVSSDSIQGKGPRTQVHIKTKTLQHGPICVGADQNVTAGDKEEDCLFVNVFSPSNATATSKLPVWVFIQGGGYAQNSNANYNGTKVVQQSEHGIVLVTLNYRVGALGFLASEQVRQDGDLNAGLLDQRMALQWVQEHIHKVQLPVFYFQARILRI
ncbi:uncharacterized protein LDX57_012731 [Aspergillus melleus]|uniref:uncharacterized protein n=1 Tax=Aspergillus melleus TaxID=138277 RepID=UPI001E8E971F|nr:uncharacterized protein LDX57_012731 [Aspergillus melleus]KAH8435102.1 hypothetical protein LDX57_012731 [Aspergillus melleus]